MKATLKKIARRSESMVDVGDGESGELFIARDGALVPVPSLDNIQVGDMLFINPYQWNYLKTSPIATLVSLDGNKLVVETQTSTYEVVAESLQ